MKTKPQIEAWLADNQHRMDGPAQWLGDEPNSYRKPWDQAQVRMSMFACWGMEQAAGNQAIPIVYRLVNELGPEFLCDRSYFPYTPRDLRMLESAGVPMFGIEQKHGLADYDIVGTSVSYPVLSINFIKQLAMSGIPPTWEDREDLEGTTRPGRYRNPEKWPFVIVGGQGYGAPEVLANIADCVFCGEVEDEPGHPGLGDVLRRIRDFKLDGLWKSDRMACYRALAVEFEFLYFPSFIEVLYDTEDRPSVAAVVGGQVHPSRQVVGYRSLVEGMRLPIVKRFVRDLNAVEGMDNPPLLYTDTSYGLGDIEAGRGCPAWCSFCALSWRQKPFRQRSVDYMVDLSARLVRNTGAMDIAPFSPDFPMHTNKKRLLKGILEQVSDEVNASSMRVDDFIADPNYILIQAHGGMNTVTLGVEGNSQRMRDFVGKGSADEDIKEAVARGIRAGINKFKLYMIASLPGEDSGDIRRILNLAKELADIRDGMQSQARFVFSWTPCLIEGNTPLQWFAPTGHLPNYALADAWETLRDLGIEFRIGSKAQPDRLLFFQLSQRANREIGKAMVEAVAAINAGTWGGAPRGLMGVVEEFLHRHGFQNGVSDAFDEREKADMFGWEMIDQGINVELMWVTYQRMREFLEHTDSETYDLHFHDDYHGNEWLVRCDEKCYGKSCGVCSPEDLKIRRGYIEEAALEPVVDINEVRVIDERSLAMKVRVQINKDRDHRFVMNDHWRIAVRRALLQAGVPMVKRSVRFATDELKIKDWTSGMDYVEFGVTRRIAQGEMDEMLAKFAEVMAPIEVVSWQLRPSSSDVFRDQAWHLYDMEVDVTPEEARAAIRRWHEAEYVPLTTYVEHRQSSWNRVEVNAKEEVRDLWLVQRGASLHVRMMIRGKVLPYNVYTALFQKVSWLDAARYPAQRVEVFLEMAQEELFDFFRLNCDECGSPIPNNLLDNPYDLLHCPRCLDTVTAHVPA